VKARGQEILREKVMRPILFRAYDKIGKRMLKLPIASYETKEATKDFVVGYHVTYSFFSNRTVADTGSIVLLQYTGIKDRYGREIYEDDIIRWWDKYGDECIHEVKWIEKFACWDFPMFQIDKRGDFYLMEVIGNSWENPDLLEEFIRRDGEHTGTNA
jgi:hypothetical protein